MFERLTWPNNGYNGALTTEPFFTEANGTQLVTGILHASPAAGRIGIMHRMVIHASTIGASDTQHYLTIRSVPLVGVARTLFRIAQSGYAITYGSGPSGGINIGPFRMEHGDHLEIDWATNGVNANLAISGFAVFEFGEYLVTLESQTHHTLVNNMVL